MENLTVPSARKPREMRLWCTDYGRAGCLLLRFNLKTKANGEFVCPPPLLGFPSPLTSVSHHWHSCWCEKQLFVSRKHARMSKVNKCARACVRACLHSIHGSTAVSWTPTLFRSAEPNYNKLRALRGAPGRAPESKRPIGAAWTAKPTTALVTTALEGRALSAQTHTANRQFRKGSPFVWLHLYGFIFH